MNVDEQFEAEEFDKDRDHHDDDHDDGGHHRGGHHDDDDDEDDDRGKGGDRDDEDRRGKGHDDDEGHHHAGHHDDDDDDDDDDDCDDDDDDVPPPCFVRGTLIETPDGAVPVERLRAGDRVVCADGSVLPILWAGGRVLDEVQLQERPHLRPVVIKHGSLGNRRDLRLSPQHAVVLDTPEGAKLARATHLAQRGAGRFRVAHGMKTVSYHHLLLPRHALLLAEGAVVESMWPGPVAMAAVGAENRGDILLKAPQLKPALDGDVPVEHLYGPRAAPMLRGREVKAMARIETPERPAMTAMA